MALALLVDSLDGETARKHGFTLNDERCIALPHGFLPAAGCGFFRLLRVDAEALEVVVALDKVLAQILEQQHPRLHGAFAAGRAARASPSTGAWSKRKFEPF